MAGNLEDSSKWRLKTSTGIPYKVLSMDGSLGVEDANISVTMLIEATNLLAFAAFLMPPPISVGNIEYPTFSSLAGIPQIAVKNIRFRSFDDSLPIDPFSADFAAPGSTYFPVIQVDINYQSSKTDSATQQDPFTFLEISGNATGQFLHVSLENARWQPQINPDIDENDETFNLVDAVNGIDIDTNAANSCAKKFPNDDDAFAACLLALEDGDEEVNRDPTIPVPILVPQTEWTVSWPQIRFDLFRDVYIHRLRIILGRVNSTPFPLLFNAEAETLLFMGYSYKQTNTWRDDHINEPIASLELKFVEKRIMWKGVIIGHNHFWRPGKGWQLLYLDEDKNRAYRRWDFNNVFKI